jgi:hypothetical protein
MKILLFCDFSGFQVHGSGFKVDRFALFIFLEIVDESVSSGTDVSSLIVNIFKFFVSLYAVCFNSLAS